MAGKIRTYDGAVALITGGASGIGRAIGQELARRGADVVLADVQGELAGEAAEAIRSAGGRATGATLDVRDYAAVERVVDETVARTGRLDYVFNNAGTGTFGEVHLLEAKDWDLVVDVNLRGVVHVIRATYPRMVAEGYGHLVNTASMAGLVTCPFFASYAATKHAVVGLSKALRIEAARFGVRVSALCPSAIRTPILTGGAQGRCIYDISPDRMLQWWSKVGIADLEPFAKQAADCVAKNEGIIALPRKNRAILALMRLIPGFEELAAKKLFDWTLRTFPEIDRAPKRSETRGDETPAHVSP
jgi:NAD(P)-dependent dehydrogenase (short-subunit alcohol dehydrogenase family)